MSTEKKEHYFEKIQKLLQEKIGLLASSLSSQNWNSCIDKRMIETGKKDYTEYYAFLLSSVMELQELIDLIVIPETWFYREDRAFKFLAEYVKKYGDQYRMGTPLRILSLGCSTGEEPYSIVMCLLEAGMPLGSFRIEGVDVSKNSLNKAQKGLYGLNSFRTIKTKLRNKYFSAIDQKFQLSDQVRFTVKFKKGNVVNFPTGFSKNLYDVIFCRNLLIYLLPQLQENLLKRLERNLSPNGVLILGEAEYGKINQVDFDTLSLRGTTAYCKKAEESETQKEIPEALIEQPKKQSSIEMIRLFADRGDFAAAKKEIEAYKDECKEDPELHFLQGVIHHASGEQDLALKYFQKTICLEPNHVEALTYLSLLTDGAVAERYRMRATQVKEGS